MSDHDYYHGDGCYDLGDSTSQNVAFANIHTPEEENGCNTCAQVCDDCVGEVVCKECYENLMVAYKQKVKENAELNSANIDLEEANKQLKIALFA
ncbi:hypothetical protein KAR91_18265, partial [Candidatus Pacearchaeota archaeon]|nr:hypothetical protein [Candidatus Pacearchaeota archaeon]